MRVAHLDDTGQFELQSCKNMTDGFNVGNWTGPRMAWRWRSALMTSCREWSWAAFQHSAMATNGWLSLGWRWVSSRVLDFMTWVWNSEPGLHKVEVEETIFCSFYLKWIIKCSSSEVIVMTMGSGRGGSSWTLMWKWRDLILIHFTFSFTRFHYTNPNFYYF